jgi:uncharacterized protein GlcG (DUF336 family)
MIIPHRCATSVAALALFASFAAFGEEATENKPMSLASADRITLKDATRMAMAAAEDCAKRGQPTSVIVVDATGFQRIAVSDDNAKFIGVAHNLRKAATVLAFKTSTQVLQARAESDKQFAEQYGKDERYMFQGGGLPIYKDGKLVAAISVGGSGNFNDACAQAGVKVLSWATIEVPQSSSIAK